MRTRPARARRQQYPPRWALPPPETCAAGENDSARAGVRGFAPHDQLPASWKKVTTNYQIAGRKSCRRVEGATCGRFGRGSGRIASPAQRERPPTEGRRERVRAHGTPAPCLKPCLPSPVALRAPASPRCAPLRGARQCGRYAAVWATCGRPPGQARARAPAVHARCGHHRDGRRDRLRGDGVEPGESRSVPLPVGAHRYPDLCSQVLSGTRVPTQGLPFFGRGSGRIASPASAGGRRPKVGGRGSARAGNAGSVLEALSPLTRRAARRPLLAALRFAGARHMTAGPAV